MESQYCESRSASEATDRFELADENKFLDM